mgnify:FL=1
MWKRKVLKKKTRMRMKQTYWRMISVCFLAAMLAGLYPVSATFLGSQASLPSPERNMTAPFAAEITNSEVISDLARRLFKGTFISDFFRSPFSTAADIAIELGTTSSSAFFSFLRAVNNFFVENWDISTLILIIGVVLSILYQIFISNLLNIGEKRFFLENHSYRQTPVSKIFFLYKLRVITHPAWIMFCRALFQFFWSLTIVGGVIKYYEYRMIPYILAENPKISRKDAFFLSKQLMKHNKYKLFLLHLSFIGWKILSLFTFGILDFLFVNPYLTGTEAELYLNLRRNYVLSRSARYEHLNDSYLEHVPSEDELLISKALYDDSRGPYTQISYFAPEQYPVFLFSVQPPFKAVRSPVKSDRTYAFLSCVFLFHVFSILGWVCEMSVQLLVNGTTDGLFSPFSPWMPIYGIFGILILLVCRHFIHKPVLVFLLNFMFYSVLEFAVSWITEFFTGTQPWDYSGYSLNIDGRIYAGGSIAAALLGCAFLYYLAPRITDRFMKLRKFSRTAICAGLTILLLADIIFRIHR